MRLSQFFLPLIKENPAEAQIVSHRLMLRAGMVRQLSGGIYSWLPLGLRVLNNIANIVREEQNKAGMNEILMPTIQPAELWKESGRYDDYGKEMLRITDRHEREMLYGPTNEEVVTTIFRDAVKSYKNMPAMLYHIQWKFRDEIRPRFGVMRGREFLMKDAYSFDIDEESAIKSYNLMYDTYLNTFARLGVAAVAVRAPTGPIGGSLSHEFHIVAETGESEIYYDAQLDDIRDGKITMSTEQMRELYAMEVEQHDPEQCDVPAERLRKARGIEVGHIFNFGTKYTECMNARIAGPDGQMVAPNCGSYGIGVSRLVGGIIEACHDENGIVWPEEVAPFKVGLVNIRGKDEACVTTADNIYNLLQNANVEVLYDDTEESAGKKFAAMDLIGLPWQIVVGPRGVEAGTVELKNRKSGEKQELSLESALEMITKRKQAVAA
ncbi:MAG: proline--tRNA ligase [Alphaproteobacteria bacterium]|nr:proline--tRNA ligase [Alphaproteobacteria bacterium]